MVEAKEEPQSLPMEQQSLFEVKEEPHAQLEVKEEEFKKVPAPQVQLTPVYKAYMLLSPDPKYSVPSGPSTADE